MGQYQGLVERQRLLIKAEEWAIQPKDVHIHSISSMWYDDRPEDTENGSVTDIAYNGGWIDRHKNGRVIHTFGKKFSRSELIDAYEKANAN